MSRKPNLSPLFTWRSAVCESGLRPSVRHVALTLSTHMSERGDSCFPSLATLAEETGLHKETVHKAIAELEEASYLQVTRPETTGRGRANHYRACVPERSDEQTVSPDERSDQPTVSDHEKGSGEPTVSGEKGRMESKKGSDQPTVGRQESATTPSAPSAPRARNQAFDALAASTGWDPRGLTKTAAGEIGGKLAEIRAAEAERLGGMPSVPDLCSEIWKRARAYRRRHPTWDLTPSALAKYWPELGERPRELDPPRAEPEPEPEGGYLTDAEIAQKASEARRHLAERGSS